jgi:hypothetical protein
MRGSRQEPATLLLSRIQNDGHATDMVTLKQRWVCGRVNRMGKAGRTSEAMATRTSQYPLAHSDSVRRSRRSLARMDSLSSVVGSARRAGRGAGWLDLLPIRIRFFPGVTSFIVFKILRLLCSGNLCQGGGGIVEISPYWAPGMRCEEGKSHSSCVGSWQEADLERGPAIEHAKCQSGQHGVR